jgi:hypothetical protein
MTGPNLKNIYVIDDKQDLIDELSKDHLNYVNSIADRSRYNDLRNKILWERCNDIICTITIHFPLQKMIAHDELREVLLVSEMN